MASDRILFVIQARSGSTRLPGKILLPFYDGKCILQLLLEKLKGIEEADVLLATTDNPHDDAVAEMAMQCGVEVFRGSEEDVLQRFIDAAESMGRSRIIRVCSDNPFLDVESIKRLISYADAHADADYISFDINGTPSIKTHYGFWTEYVTLEALKRVRSLTEEKLYHEHVTNYIYSHPECFHVEWIEGASALLGDMSIRLTIDTEVDFDNARQIYAALQGSQPVGIEQVVQYVKEHPQLLQIMKSEIDKNSK